jgi:hypothetical protein
MNFRQVSGLCNSVDLPITKTQCLKYMVLHKIQRIFKLVDEEGDPKNESLLDNLVDIIVYLALLIGTKVTMGDDNVDRT